MDLRLADPFGFQNGRPLEAFRRENLGAADVELTTEDLQSIDHAVAGVTVQGARYSDASQRMIDR